VKGLPPGRRIVAADIGAEPYRAFFPAGIVAGLVGVSLWPLYFAGLLGAYPGVAHARIMAFGLFGGFIFGFLGTAMPGMLSSRRLTSRQVVPLALLHLAMVAVYSTGAIWLGDILFALLLLAFTALLVARFRERKGMLPPGFVLVGLAALCLAVGVALALLGHVRELGRFWSVLQRLLTYQGFVLLPILGIGPFILPGLLRGPGGHSAPVHLGPGPSWRRTALVAAAAGALIVASFVIEAAGWPRSGHLLRFGTALGYALAMIPLHRDLRRSSTPGLAARVAFLSLLAGLLAVGLWPAQRTGLLHLTLIGGFAVITLVVAMRVVYIHSGQQARLAERNRWLILAVGLMLFGMATRISGDLWPAVQASHFGYGALAWMAGVLVWSGYVLPKVLVSGRAG